MTALPTDFGTETPSRGKEQSFSAAKRIKCLFRTLHLLSRTDLNCSFDFNRWFFLNNNRFNRLPLNGVSIHIAYWTCIISGNRQENSK